MNWIPITEKMPPSGKAVLAGYKNQYGKFRVVVAFWAAKKTIEADYENDADDECIYSEYDEETDLEYCKEGWYEQLDNWSYSYCPVSEGTVTHWMPLPSPPEDI